MRRLGLCHTVREGVCCRKPYGQLHFVLEFERKHFMNMKTSLCALLSACLILTGCGAAPDQEAGTSGIPSWLGTADGQIRFLSADPDSIGSGTEGEEGYYYATASEDYTHGNLRFIDKTSLQDIVLCSSPNCEHDTDACPACIDTNKDYLPSLVFADGKLVLFYAGFNTSELQICPRIDVMNADGSGRRTVYTFEANQEYGNGIAGDGQFLYFILTTYNTEGAVSALVKLDMDSGELHTVCEVDPYSFLMGSYGNKLILKTIGNSMFLFSSESESGESAFLGQQHFLFAVDGTTGEAVPLMNWKQDEYWEVLGDGQLFLFSMPNDVLHLTVRDLADGSDTEYDLGIAVEQPKNIMNLSYHKGTLLFDLLSGYTEEGSLISRYLAFTPETEDLREINIYDPVRGYSVPIVGELGDGVILQMPYYNGSDISSFDRYRFKYCSWQDFMNSQLPE